VHKTVDMENKGHVIYTYTNINALQKNYRAAIHCSMLCI